MRVVYPLDHKLASKISSKLRVGWERRTSQVIIKRLDGYEAMARRPVSAVLTWTERTYLDSLEENAFELAFGNTGLVIP